MKKVLLSTMIGAIVLLWALPTQAGARGAGGASVECWQGGVTVVQVPAGTMFSIRGAGFRPELPVWVCISGDTCVLSEVDRIGSFSQDRSLATPGTSTITVSQARNRQLDAWTPKASMTITIM